MTNKPFLVVSYSIPNRASGTPVVIRKFLENFEGNEVVLIGRPTRKIDRISNLRFKYPVITIPTPPVGFRGERLWRLLSIFPGVLLGLLAIQKYRLKAVLAIYRDEGSLLTGYLLAWLTKLPLYVYFCDLYLENYSEGVQGRLARWLQPRIFQKAKAVLVLTDGMKEYFLEKYIVNSVVLPHCQNKQPPKYTTRVSEHQPFKIAYLGSVNIDRIPSLRILCNSIAGNTQFCLTYFTTASDEFLRRQELLISNSEIKFIASDELLADELRSCDLLFLPLTTSAEHSNREPQMSTGFPTKAIDYLCCQKPILVHCSKQYFAAKFFEKFGCGYVVTGESEIVLPAIQRIKNDLLLQEQLANNAYEAIVYFDGQKIAETFRNILELS